MKLRAFRVAAAGLVLLGAIWAQTPATRGPWELSHLRTPPTVWWGDKTGPQRSLYYENEPYQGHPTRVFAYYALPEHYQGKLPAMVLVHGGGGHAFPQWTTIWAQRGYAAISMDLSGCGPDLQRHAYAGPDQSDREKFYGLAAGERAAWSYHSIAAIMRAVSFLAAQPEIDPDRIGITGISWGGYLTSLVAGLDDRLKVAIPVYGCGFLHENSVWKPLFEQLPPGLRARWIRAFDPSSYLAEAHMPILWINGTNDFAYPLDSYQKSYRLPPGPRTLRITVNMPHGHTQGWEPLEICIFADQYLRHGTPLPQLGPLQREGSTVRVKLHSATPILDAKLHYSESNIAWYSQHWTSVPAIIKADSVEATLPADRPLAYFLTVTDNRGAIVSTEHEQLLPVLP